MSPLGKCVVFFLLSLAVVFSGLDLLRNNEKCVNESMDNSADFDNVGQVFFSCNLDGLQIEKDMWRDILIERNLQGKPVLVVWHSHLGCKTCNDFVFTQVEKKIGNNLPVLFIGTDYRSRNSTDSEVYLSPNESLGLSVEELKVPFMFVYDSEIRHLFVPDTRNEEAIDMYLDVVSMRYGLKEL